MTTRFLLGAALVSAAGCGPSIGETRMAYYPPREASCELNFVQMDMQEMAPGGRWEVVGYVTLQETGVADPFSEEYKAIVRPRACQMGGEAVAIAISSTSEAAMGSGSGTAYAVLRARTGAGTNPSTPQAF